MENPLLSLGLASGLASGQGPLPIPFDRILPEHVEPAISELIARSEAALDAIERAPRTYQATLGALETATEQLDLSMNVVDHLQGVATTPALRSAYDAANELVSAFRSSIALR